MENEVKVVYIVSYSDYDIYEIVGGYRDHDKAVDECNRLNKENKTYNYEVQELEVL